MYKDLKPEIDAGYAAVLEKWNSENNETEKTGEKKPVRFTFQNAFLMARYLAESDEMKAKVEEHRMKMLEVGSDEVNRLHQM